ncbi:MAG: A/G-specific adenine glycosylase [Bacteroidetes bacterium]|nr:A/G-specific adenine glycosylase [Bacteroidota bacterium]
MDIQLAFTRSLMGWHWSSNRRVMPWKGERDPYRIWLSEVILQQTRVEQGWSYYERFIAAYPSICDLAAASDDEVFKQWEGLGYYSRCRNLLATARFIADKRAGAFPVTYEGILALKGVGPYTAAAIASFAYGLPHAVVDGNVIRVLARCFAIREPVGDPVIRRKIIALAATLLDVDHPGAYNQAIMDFGATVCRPQAPQCSSCPLSAICSARALGLQGEIPAKAVRPVRKTRWFQYIHAGHAGSCLVRQRTARDIWQDLHELLLVETEGPLTVDALSALPLSLGLRPTGKPWVSDECRQLLTHQEIRARFVRVQLGRRDPAPEGYRWMVAEEVSRAAFPKIIQAYFEYSGTFT